jgi:hypothetical protein
MVTRREYAGSVSLIVTARDLDPAVVSSLLRMMPTKSWRRGSLDDRLPGVRNINSGWKRLLPPSKKRQPIEGQLRYWARMLDGKGGAFRKLGSRGYYCRLSWFVASEATVSILVKPPVQADLARLGLIWEISVSFSK